MMFFWKKYAVLFFFLVLFHLNVFGQTKNNPIIEINRLISNNELDDAQFQIKKALSMLEEGEYGWNAGDLVYALGKIEFLRNPSTAFNQANNLLTKFKTLYKPDSVVYQSYLNLGLLYDEQGSNTMALENIQKAASIARKLKEPFKLIESEYYLGEMSLKTGNLNGLSLHTDNALNFLRTYKAVKHPLAPRIYNYKASLMHFFAQPDSANHYFKKALDNLTNMKNTPENQYYLPGTIYGNWFLVKQSEGDYDAAMNFTLKSIKYFKKFIAEVPNNPLTQKVQSNLSIAYRNLGSLYNDMGYMEKAKHMAKTGYIHAKKHFLPNTISYYNAILMLGEAYLYNNELDKAKVFLREAGNSLRQVPGENLFYTAGFYSVMAQLERRSEHLDSAINYYLKASNTILKSEPDQFSQNFIFNEISLAEAYAENNEPDKASNRIAYILDKTEKHYGHSSYLANNVRISKARIEFMNKNYKKAITTCDNLLTNLNNNYDLTETNNLYYETNLPEVFLLKAKANFKLLPNHAPEKAYTPILVEIDYAIKQLEKQKTFMTSRDEVAGLIENNNRVFDFAKKINLELYQKTNNNHYLKTLLELHESSIYSRIRSRLSLRENELALVPKNVADKEKTLKRKLNSFFGSADNIEIDSLQQAGKDWNSFLKLLKQQYPEYYSLRYASILQELGNIKKKLPQQTTIVRYLFIDHELYAYVLNKQSEGLYPLNVNWAENEIQSFKNLTTEDIISKLTYSLYQQLWKPFENKVNTPNIVILPDAELYNLPFEVLTAKKINSLKELSTKSLMSKYNISYNYSLLLINNEHKSFDFDQDFIAFVPGFTDKMKNEYELSISDSLDLDRTYLRLLPQPFTTDLVKQVGKKYSGQSFLNEKASKQLFINNAREHKIIHVGTHAESNNINPELSRLVFAKNLSDARDKNDNYLYAYEIYNLNLSAELAVLTACETGKPTYQPGEGMISLAHAFNYAGSESILTSLWEIDEKSSTEILNNFYIYLTDGKRKDEALRLAKLDYLENASGRTIHPQYWAGLILMGNSDPLRLSHRTSWGWVVLFSVMVLGILIFVFYFKKNAAGKYQQHQNN